MDNIILFAVTSVTVIGAVCAAMLCIASKAMAVKVDERIAKIEAALPGSNCGACGFPGCGGYADALVNLPGTKPNLCPPGGAAVAEQIGEIMGTKAEALERTVAVVRCLGDRDALQKKMDYTGIPTCYAAKEMFSGEGACAFGCLGYGDCLLACPNEAIHLHNGLARVIPSLCISCGLCVKACPNHIISMEKESIATEVLCNNIEKGAVVRKKCGFGCIACRKCAKECPADAIAVEDNLAVIDHDKCTACGHCAEICITHSIQKMALKQ
ncbi:MAG: RnfABCDGE type electron transport complex subunit B [Oscillospiraceae bacterium]|nr:RnfABCDGE type electron transport complex subunit B [Oscillospiraceae bacterium]